MGEKRKVEGGRLRSLCGIVDRELALWVELVWCRLRTRPSPRLGYASSNSSRLDREIWDVLQAELTPAADTVTLTQTSCTFHFISQESISRIFFPARFAQIACGGGGGGGGVRPVFLELTVAVSSQAYP